MERRFGVKTRWRLTDREYLDTRRASLTEKFSQLHTCLCASVVKWHYLPRMKAKYAGFVISYLYCSNAVDIIFRWAEDSKETVHHKGNKTN